MMDRVLQNTTMWRCRCSRPALPLPQPIEEVYPVYQIKDNRFIGHIQYNLNGNRSGGRIMFPFGLTGLQVADLSIKWKHKTFRKRNGNFIKPVEYLGAYASSAEVWYRERVEEQFNNWTFAHPRERVGEILTNYEQYLIDAAIAERTVDYRLATITALTELIPVTPLRLLISHYIVF